MDIPVITVQKDLLPWAIPYGGDQSSPFCHSLLNTVIFTFLTVLTLSAQTQGNTLGKAHYSPVIPSFSPLFLVSSSPNPGDIPA